MAIDLRSIPGWSLVALLGFPAAGQTALMERSIDGVDLFYDSVLDITWLGNANLAATETFGVPQTSYLTPNLGAIGSTGRMRWDTAMDWIAGMNDQQYLGLSQWRLPVTIQPDDNCTSIDDQEQGFGYDCTRSEMGHLYAYGDLELFQNLQLTTYWSGTEYVNSGGNQVWSYDFGTGYQDSTFKTVPLSYAWAVIDGDVSPIPLPAAGWVFLSALAGLGGLAWRQRQATA